jgi:[NiFe] hydrogenase diaphorase moiety small subunit
MRKKVTFTIDGKSCQAREGDNLVQAAAANGVQIPSLCYYEHIDPPLGTCRVCMVKENGKPTSACTLEVRDGMDIQFDSEWLQDMRKAMVELLFAEGNHFCPACEKSGDCDLQGLGYQLGVQISRFPHFFLNRMIDYRPQRMVIEHNRCILCRRCVEEVLTQDGFPVFSFLNRGGKTEVRLDYNQEAKLTEKEAVQAMHICPTGAILVRGKSHARPRGERKYDLNEKDKNQAPAKLKWPARTPNGKKKVIATTSLAGCFGCHMSLLDIDEEVMEALEFIEFDKSPLTDIKTFTRRCDVGIIEGGCCNDENIEVLEAFRANCDVLIAVGECAIWGGLPAMRNMIPIEECLDEAYGYATSSQEMGKVIPYHEDLPKLLDRVYGCNEMVKIDYFVPGCPPDAHYMWKVLQHVLFGEEYSIIESEIKYD